MSPHPKISVVVVIHDMRREAPRTLLSLSPEYQTGIAASDYEVLVYENGSTTPLDPAVVAALPPNFRYTRIDTGAVSPVAAINLGLAEARGELIGVMIDGARLVTPGLLGKALQAASTGPRRIVATMGWYLGWDQQGLSAATQGYNAEVEDSLLASINWPAQPYRLFEIAVQDPSSVDGWFSTLSESNTLFLPRTLWQELGGYDAGFNSAGGGWVNLDTFRRACDLPEVSLVLLLDEASFHQIHGGVATNAPPREIPGRQARWREEFREVRGRDRQPVQEIERILLGTLRPEMAPAFAWGLLNPLRDRHYGLSRNTKLLQKGALDPAKPRTPTEQQALPADVGAALSIANACFARRDWYTAREVCRRILSAAPTCLAAQRMLRLVAHALAPGPKTPPGLHAALLATIARACRVLGRPTEARKLAEQALALDPTNAASRSILAAMDMPGRAYLDVLSHLHQRLQPSLYLEIGVASGDSLKRAKAPTRAIAIDPEPQLSGTPTVELHLLPMTSDAFFTSARAPTLLEGGIDLAFIDGLHEFTQVVRDLWYVERHCGPHSVVVLHDTVPFDALTSSVERSTDWWTGDVWKMLPFLAEHRPDLECFTVRTPPSGLTIIRGLNPTRNTPLAEDEARAAIYRSLRFEDYRERWESRMRFVAADLDVIDLALADRLPPGVS